MRYAQNYTPRWKIGYTSHGVEHHMTIRLHSSVASVTADMVNNVVAATQAIQGILPQDFGFTSSEYSAAGSDFFLPALDVPSDPNQETEGYDHTNALLKSEKAGEIKFHWKGVDGTKTNFSIIGILTESLVVGFNRLHKAPTALMSSVNNARLNFAALPVGVSSGLVGVSLPYVTYQRNSYWESH